MVDHYVSRVCGTMQLLQQHDIIGRTSELARVFGIQFFHVLTRGSQVPTHTSHILHTLIGPEGHRNLNAITNGSKTRANVKGLVQGSWSGFGGVVVTTFPVWRDRWSTGVGCYCFRRGQQIFMEYQFKCSQLYKIISLL